MRFTQDRTPTCVHRARGAAGGLGDRLYDGEYLPVAALWKRKSSACAPAAPSR
jgi:hypothetical protein